MNRRLPPNPAQFRSMHDWARQLYDFLLSETAATKRTDPTPVQLLHRTDGAMERAVTEGLILYDPSSQHPVISINNAFVDLALATDPVASHNHAASAIISGTFANGRIAESNVTQHEAALDITESQIIDYQPGTVEIVTPSPQPSSNQNNYAPGGSTSERVFTIYNLKPNPSVKITGFDSTGVEIGKRVRVHNNSDPTSASCGLIILERLSTSSSATNRITSSYPKLPLFLMPGDSIDIIFDGTNWVAIAGSRLASGWNRFFDTYLYAGFPANFWTNGTGAGTFYNGTWALSGISYHVNGVNTGSTSGGWAFRGDVNRTTFAQDGAVAFLGRCVIDVLADATDDFNLFFGLNSTNQGAGISGSYPENVCGWVADRSQSSVDWTTVTKIGASITQNVVSDCELATDWGTVLGLFINGDQSRVDFFFSEDEGFTWSFATSHTTNIAANRNDAGGPNGGIVKKAGTNNRIFIFGTMGLLGLAS